MSIMGILYKRLRFWRGFLYSVKLIHFESALGRAVFRV